MDSLLSITERAIRTGHGVCWEGDISEQGFNWEEGYAVTSLWNGRTTDDHCMAIVGLAHDEEGEQYFIMKNSWGTKNPYDGLMYLSYGYFLRKTVAVFLYRQLICSTSR
jgi:bleomycin hydrolase